MLILKKEKPLMKQEKQEHNTKYKVKFQYI